MNYRPLEVFKSLVEAAWFSRTIMLLIFINALVLGLETYPQLMAEYGPLLIGIDNTLLWIFVAELALRLLVYRKDFFRDPWTVFDLFVVAVAFAPAYESFSVLRAARVLRVLRLISIFPRLKRVVGGLISALPGIGSIGAILLIILYVFAVMATKMFGADYPEWFGSLHKSVFSLFQIMTLEGWADMVREIMQTSPWAWLFFIIFILSATFTVLNLFIAVIVDAMQKQSQDDVRPEQETLARIEARLESLSHRLDKAGI